MSNARFPLGVTIIQGIKLPVTILTILTFVFLTNAKIVILKRFIYQDEYFDT